MIYLKGWFAFDVISIFPLELILQGIGGSTTRINKSIRVFRFVRIYKLVRLLRITRIFRKVKQVRLLNMRNEEKISASV
jgi:potassium voltage-gated channel Eag-related subfamily H protein 6/hyperpolarization activated cyclic nucleotide-gated potassium channel 2